jgi:multidrug resistance protein, MATE family
LMNLSRHLFIVAAFSIPIDAFRNIISGCFRGLRDSVTPMRVGLLSLWLVSLPLSYGFAFVLHQGPIGLRVGFAIGILIAAINTWLKLTKKERVALLSEHPASMS